MDTLRIDQKYHDSTRYFPRYRWTAYQRDSDGILRVVGYFPTWQEAEEHLRLIRRRAFERWERRGSPLPPPDLRLWADDRN